MNKVKLSISLILLIGLMSSSAMAQRGHDRIVERYVSYSLNLLNGLENYTNVPAGLFVHLEKVQEFADDRNYTAALGQLNGYTKKLDQMQRKANKDRDRLVQKYFLKIQHYASYL